MANQDYGAGQQYDQDTTNDQWAQQGGQQYDAQGSQGTMPNEWSQEAGMGGQNPDMQRGGMGRQDQPGDDMADDVDMADRDQYAQQVRNPANQSEWDQQRGGLSEDPNMPESPFGEDDRQEQGVSRRDKAVQGDIDSAFGNP